MPRLADLNLDLSFTEIHSQHDWTRLIANATGLDKRYLQAKDLALALVDSLKPKPTPEALAWLALWTRLFTAIEAADALRRVPSGIPSAIIGRAIFETELHIALIGLPLAAQRRPSLPHPDHASWAEAQNRLKGYFAWTLFHDIVHYRHRLDPAVLEKVFEATSPEDLPASEADEALLRYLSPSVEVISTQEAEADRARYMTRTRAHIGLLEDWLADSSLSLWREHLVTLQLTNKYNSPPTFYATLGLQPDSFRAGLKAVSREALYALYAEGSLLLHGSTFSGLARISPAIVLFRAFEGQGSIAPESEYIANTAMTSLMALRGLRDLIA